MNELSDGVIHPFNATTAGRQGSILEIPNYALEITNQRSLNNRLLRFYSRLSRNQPQDAGSRRKVYFLVTIDTECDKGPGWKIRYPLSFRSVTEGVPEIFTPFFTKNRLKPTYLLSPEILQDAGCVTALQQAPNAELGTHLHGEFIAPDVQEHPERTSTVQCSYTPQVELAKLKNLTELFRQQFGYPPLSFRAGRYGLSQHTLRFLSELGYTVDSSVLPFKVNRFESGHTVNTWGVGLMPYHPSPADFRRKGRLPILEVPVTHFAPDFLRLPASVLRRVKEQNPRQKRLFGKLGYKFDKVYMRPYQLGKDALIQQVRFLYESYKPAQLLFVNVMFHSNELIPGASPYCETPEEVQEFLHSLQGVWEFTANDYQAEAVTLAECTRLIG